MNSTLEEMIEYQVISRASVPCSAARVTSSITTRQQAAASAHRMPTIASVGRVRADHQREAEKRGDRRERAPPA